MINDENFRSIFLDRLGILEGIKIIDPEKIKNAAKTPYMGTDLPANTVERNIPNNIDNMHLTNTTSNKVQSSQSKQLLDGSIHYNKSDSLAHLRVTPHASN